MNNIGVPSMVVLAPRMVEVGAEVVVVLVVLVVIVVA